MRLLSEEIIQNPGLKDLSSVVQSLLLRPDKKADLVFDNGDYIRIKWDKSRGVYLLFYKDGTLSLVNRQFAPSFHDVEILLYRSVRGEKPKAGETWETPREMSLFKKAPYIIMVARLLIYLCFGLILSMFAYEMFLGAIKMNYRVVLFLMSTVIGLSLSIELYPFYRYNEHLGGSFFKDNVKWGFWLCVSLCLIGLGGLFLF